MVDSSLIEQSRQFNRFHLSGMNKHVGEFFSKYEPLFLIAAVDQPWL